MIFHVLSPTEIYQIPLISCRFLTTLSCKIIRIKGGGGWGWFHICLIVNFSQILWEVIYIISKLIPFIKIH